MFKFPLALTLAGVLTGCSLDPQSTTLDEDQQKGYAATSEKAFLAFIKVDRDGIMQYTHESLVDGIGESRYRELIDGIPQSYQQTVIGHQLDAPKCLEAQRLVCVARYQAVVKPVHTDTPEKPAQPSFVQGYMVAISDDNGDNWGYLQGNDEKDSVVRKLVPELPAHNPSIQSSTCTAELCDWATETAKKTKDAQ